MQKKCIQLIVLKITSLDYNGANSYLFVNGTEIYQFQDSEMVATPLCLRNILKDFTVDNTKKAILNMFMILVLIMLLHLMIKNYIIENVGVY